MLFLRFAPLPLFVFACNKCDKEKKKKWKREVRGDVCIQSHTDGVVQSNCNE